MAYLQMYSTTMAEAMDLTHQTKGPAEKSRKSAEIDCKHDKDIKRLLREE